MGPPAGSADDDQSVFRQNGHAPAELGRTESGWGDGDRNGRVAREGQMNHRRADGRKGQERAHDL